MSEITDALLDGLLEREADCESTIAIGGQSYPCSGGAEFGGKKLDFGGFALSADVAIVVRTGLFATPAVRPQEKQTLVYTSAPGAAGKRLRIDSVTPVYDALLVLQCNDPSKGV